MFKRLILIFLLILSLSLFLFLNRAFALETKTHQDINGYVANMTLPNGFNLNAYLKDNLGLSGIGAVLTENKNVEQWIKLGGEYEDSPPEWYSIPYLRSVNHLHNPITKQGYDGLWWLLWGGFGYLNGVSSLQWAQEDTATQSPYGYFSWKDTRKYFYTALTGRDYDGNIVASTKDQRDSYFTDTFRGLGQLMHLVEDVSVPAHTRNDGHVPCWMSYHYECWVKDNIKSDADIALYTPIYFDPSTIGNTNTLASIPVTNLFDTNIYNGTNPNDTYDVVASLSKIGLSEYTNANFLSPDSMFTPSFNYPDWNSIVQNPDPDPVTKRRYLTKLGKDDPPVAGGIGNGEHVDHLAVSRWGYNLLPAAISQNGIYLKMDKQVYSDYASKLIPRAVGYSAGLLNYFFRGQIDMAPDPSSPGDYIIENYGGEAINASDGIFTLYYDGTDELRHEINWTYPSDGRISVPAANGNDPGKSTSVSFLAPTDAKEPGKYILVYKGTLGNEKDIAVIGKEVKEDDIVIVGNTSPDNPNIDKWTVQRWHGEELLWEKFNTNFTYPYPNAVAANSSGVYVSGSGDGGFVVEKRNVSTGEQLWQRIRSESWADALTIGLDNTGVYAGGHDRINGLCIVEKRDLSNGDILWEKKDYNEWVEDMATDGSAIYTVGDVFEGGADQWVVTKRDINTGEVLSRIVSLPKEYNYPSAIAVYGDFIFTAGQVYDAFSPYYWRIEKRNKSDLSLVWEMAANEHTSASNYPGDIVADATGVYIVGQSEYGGWRSEKRRLDDGVLLWSQDRTMSSAFGVAVSSKGVYIVGNYFTNGYNPYWYIEKVDGSNGSSLWSHTGNVMNSTSQGIAVVK